MRTVRIILLLFLLLLLFSFRKLYSFVFHIFCDNKVTAVEFNAETHVKSFSKTFENLGFDKVSDFAMAQVADSTALNPKIARLLEIVHIACRNHALNLACKDMEEDDEELAGLATETQEVHRTINASNILTATMYNVQQSATSLRLLCQTRWGSICALFNSHLQNVLEIREIADAHPDRVSDRTVSRDYMQVMGRHTAYLNQVNSVAAALQAQGATLADYQDALDLLNDMVQEGREEVGNDFEFCMLQGEKFLVGNRYDSGEIMISLLCLSK